MSAVEIEEAVSSLAAAPFDPTEFPYAFLEVFGNKEAEDEKRGALGMHYTSVPNILKSVARMVQDLGITPPSIDPQSWSVSVRPIQSSWRSDAGSNVKWIGSGKRRHAVPRASFPDPRVSYVASRGKR